MHNPPILKDLNYNNTFLKNELSQEYNKNVAKIYLTDQMNKLMLFQLVSQYHCGNQRNLQAILFALPDAFGSSLSQTDFSQNIFFSRSEFRVSLFQTRVGDFLKQHYIRGLVSDFVCCCHV